MAIDMGLTADACLESHELVGLLTDNKLQSSKGLTTMFATYSHTSDAKNIEFDQLINDTHFGMTPAVHKCYMPPDQPDSGFVTKTFRPASYADSWEINNCDRCPPKVPLERPYNSLNNDEKLMVQRIGALNIMEARRENRWEHDIASLIQESGFWVRYQDERGQETDREYVVFPRDSRLSGAATGTSWADPNANIKCDIQQFIDVHSNVACRQVRKVIFGANIMKCIRSHQQFDICLENAKLSDMGFAPRFQGTNEMMEPCNHMFDGMMNIGSYCEVDYYVNNSRYKDHNGQLQYFLDPDCVYTVALNVGQDAVAKLFSKFTTLKDGPVENEVWHREFYQERPDTLELDDRYCGMPGLLYENVFAKWRVK